MDVADSSESETFTATPATIAADALRSAPGSGTKEIKGRDPSVIPAVAPGDATVDLSDPADLMDLVDSTAAAGPLAPRGDQIGTDDGTTAPPPRDDPSAVPTMTRAGSFVTGTPRERPVPAVVGYEILGELGRGGMGVVYRARQLLLNRPCVLKMILGGAHAGAEAIVRFMAEAEVVARLRHANVVQIYHIGETDGLPYFELEYVEGGSLDQQLDGTPWQAKRAATLIESLARGVAEAHRLGIVHRDLKPANVLLATDGTPKVADFGIAKSTTADSGLTRTDSIMGSPGYMAPEQAEGKAKEAGPLADVFALGAMLYELLTGRPPFRCATVLETLEQVKSAEPVLPSRLVSGLPRDIETIALRCLQKEPAKRYDSAAMLAEDLRRFLAGEPIVARPVPFWERGWRWCRRHPAPAAMSIVIFLLSAFGLTGILWQWREAVHARDLASKHAFAERTARREIETTLVDMYTSSGISAGEQGDHSRAALWFANAARRSAADPDRSRSNAIRARTWGRRAFSPLRAVVDDGSWPGAFDLHPGGRYLIAKTVVDGNNGGANLRLWDLESEQSLTFPGGLKSVPAAAWSPDGSTLAVGGAEGDVVLTRFPDADSGTRIQLPGRIRLLIYSADGRYLAIAVGKTARVWDVQARAFATPELVHPDEVSTLAFHPDGRFLATGCKDNKARLFAVPGDVGSPLWPPVAHRHETSTGWYREFCSPPMFVNGGRELIASGGKGQVAWHAVETGAEVRAQTFPEWSRGVAATDLSPDGRYLAVIGVQLPPTVRLVEVATGRVIERVLEHENTVMSVAFSPDSRMLATSSTDATVRLWAVPSGEPLARPLDFHRTVHRVAFAPIGRFLITQDSDLVRLWALPEEAVPMTRVSLDGGSSFVALSPDGARAIPTGYSYQSSRSLRSTRAYDVATGLPAGPPLRAADGIVDAAFSSDGRSVAIVRGPDNPSTNLSRLVVYDWASGRRKWRAALPSEPRSVSYRPGGGRLAVLCGEGELLIYDTESCSELRRWRAHDEEPAHHWFNNGKVGFSPDGLSVMTWGMGNDLRVWEPDSGQLRYPPLRHRDKCHDVQFSADGQLMALASYDRSVRVRDVATGTIVAELPGHPDLVFSACFSPDARLLVTACRDRAVRVWDWRAGRLVCPPFEHTKEAVAAIFTPNGRWVLSVSADGTARAWDWRIGKAITPPLTIGGMFMNIAVTPTASHAVVAGFHDKLTVLDLSGLAPTAVDPAALCRWAELLAGQRLHEGGETVNLSAEEWLDRWRESRRQSSDDMARTHINLGTDASREPVEAARTAQSPSVGK